MANAWVVRPQPHGVNRTKEFLEQDIVAIGWPDLPDLTSVRDRQAIRSALRSPARGVHGAWRVRDHRHVRYRVRCRATRSRVVFGPHDPVHRRSGSRELPL